MPKNENHTCRWCQHSWKHPVGGMCPNCFRFQVQVTETKLQGIVLKNRTPIATKHAYCPISFFKGEILKYQGMQQNQEGFETFEAEYKTQKRDGYDLGVTWLDEYKGDRIFATTHVVFKGLIKIC